MLFPGPSRTDGARFAAHLLAGVASGLGGRFFEELRDRRSLAYTVSAFASERRLAGLFVSYIATISSTPGKPSRDVRPDNTWARSAYCSGMGSGRQ